MIRRNYRGSNNPNWKGGLDISSVDEILNLSEEYVCEMKKKIDQNHYKCLETGCWIWIGPKFNSNNRASICIGVKRLLTSRVMYVLFKGVVGDLVVMHICDNTLCINPDHLVLGTNAENSGDMVSKGRSARGEKNSGAILTEQQVLEIRKEKVTRKTRTILARKYGVSWECIDNVIKRQTWRHI